MIRLNTFSHFQKHLTLPFSIVKYNIRLQFQNDLIAIDSQLGLWTLRITTTRVEFLVDFTSVLKHKLITTAFSAPVIKIVLPYFHAEVELLAHLFLRTLIK